VVIPLGVGIPLALLLFKLPYILRNPSAIFAMNLLKSVSLSIVFMSVVIQGQSANSQSCPVTLRMHGFLSKAQFECGFSRYSQDFIGEVRACSSTMSDAVAKDQISKGMTTFDDNVQERGKQQVCRSIRQTFPNIVGD